MYDDGGGHTLAFVLWVAIFSKHMNLAMVPEDFSLQIKRRMMFLWQKLL
jgi:hypothetical protein